jgi:lambda family phage tail tape measure protein
MAEDRGDATSGGLAEGLGEARGEAAELDRLMREVGVSARAISSSLSGGLKRALVDGRSLEQVFRQIALSLSERALSAALAPLESGLAGGISQLVGGLTTGLTSGLASTLATGFAGAGPVRAFAKGGVVASPTYFPLGGGAGLMGEAGAEAILPLARDASGRLGVAAGGEGAGAPAIVFNVQARDAESFARSETQIATMVARAVGRGRRGL